jgi:hypothetical protein
MAAVEESPFGVADRVRSVVFCNHDYFFRGRVSTRATRPLNLEEGKEKLGNGVSVSEFNSGTAGRALGGLAHSCFLFSAFGCDHD